MCDTSEIEDTRHLLLSCSAYDTHRRVLLQGINQINNCQQDFESMDLSTQEQTLLGKHWTDRKGDNQVDFLIKRYLKRVWRTRKKLTRLVSETFGRKDYGDRTEGHNDT